MNKRLFLSLFCLAFAAAAHADIQADGFDVVPLFKATKSFDIKDARPAAIREMIKKSKFEKNQSGGYTSNDVAYEEETYLDKDENSVKIATEKNTKTGKGKTTITIVGPEAVVSIIRSKTQ
jgi:hypothetical protein